MMDEHYVWLNDENTIEADGAPFLATALASGRWILMTSKFEALGGATAPTRGAVIVALEELRRTWQALVDKGTITW